jgi:hypothetical protein
LGIEQQTWKGVDPLVAIKHLVDIVISTGANNQEEIQYLRQENKDLK